MKEHCKKHFAGTTTLLRMSTLLMGLFCLCHLPTLQAQTIKGKATFYSKRATGARTANGERLHHDSLTCAHRTLPFGTMLRVKNPANGRQVVVRVTDRGPFVRGRIIDLSWRAAKELGIIAQGVAMVEVEKLGKGEHPIIMKDDDEEKDKLPEFDFEITGAGYSFIDEWKERQQETRKLPENKKKVGNNNATPASAASKDAKSTAKPEAEEDANQWSDVFDNLEYLRR